MKKATVLFIFAAVAIAQDKVTAHVETGLVFASQFRHPMDKKKLQLSACRASTAST